MKIRHCACPGPIGDCPCVRAEKLNMLLEHPRFVEMMNTARETRERIAREVFFGGTKKEL